MERRKEKRNAPSCGGDGWMMRMMGWWLRWSVLNARRSTKIQFGLALLCCAVLCCAVLLEPKQSGAVQCSRALTGVQCRLRTEHLFSTDVAASKSKRSLASCLGNSNFELRRVGDEVRSSVAFDRSSPSSGRLLSA
jgi:hypothetical protein